MRKLLALSYVILLAGFACIAHAQLTQTGAGKVGGGGGGGGCAGNIPPITSPNDLTNVAWSAVNINPTPGGQNPAGGTTGTTLTVASTVGAFGSDMSQVIGNAGGAGPGTSDPVRMTAYLKAANGSPWIYVTFTDNVANSFASYFNLTAGGGAVGNAVNGGAGLLTCARITVAGNNFYYTDIAGTFGVNHANVSGQFYPVDGNGVSTSTINQQVYIWGVGQ